MSDPAPDLARTGSVAAVLNPVKGDVMRVRQAIVRHAYTGGASSPSWFETTVDDEGADAARRAVESGARLVIVSGGDGTVRAVAGALRHTDVALGIIPSGTGNLLARNLGVPIGDPDAAVRLAFSGQDRVVDVGLAQFTTPDEVTIELPFMVVAGMGVDAAMIANTNPVLKERLGWIAYVDGVLRSVITSRPVRSKVHVSSAGEESLHSFDVHSVLVGNVGGLPGGVALIPGALIDDGVLDVAIMHPKTLFGWLSIGRTVVWENQVLSRSEIGKKFIRVRSRLSPNVLEYRRGEVVTVKVERPMDAELDGDEFGMVVSAVFRTDPGSLIVRVPAA